MAVNLRTPCVLRWYESTRDKLRWDRFVAESANGTIIQSQTFLGYHGDRFVDASIVAERVSDGHFVAVLPAAATGYLVNSHPGATHGGFIVSKELNFIESRHLFAKCLDMFSNSGFESMRYTPVPIHLHRAKFVADLHLLWEMGATIEARQVCSILEAGDELGRTKNRRIARKAGVCVYQSEDLNVSHQIVSATLRDRHGVTPTHSIQELKELQRLFPADFKMYLAELDGVYVATAITLRMPSHIHFQYLASTETGRQVQALDAVVEYVWRNRDSGREGLSFGASTDKSGRLINIGLQEFKEGFGARADFIESYHIPLVAGP